MSNFVDEDEEFRDNFDEDGQSQTVQQGYTQAQAQPAPKPWRSAPPTSTPQTQQAPQQQVEQEEYIEEEKEEDVVSVLSNARLRLEQGRLYEMIMNHNLFDSMDADPVAIKNVEKEIKKFAQQRMEIMLGMKQEVVKSDNHAFPADAFPFNSLEVDVLKSLAAAATQGASRDAEPFSGVAPTPKKQTLNTIGSGPKKAVAKPIVQQSRTQPAKPLAPQPTAPVKRPKIDEVTQKILAEEGVSLDQINEVFDPNKKPLTEEELRSMSDEQFKQRNREIAKRTHKSVPSQTALPMPSDSQVEAMYSMRAQAADANPQMKMIMGLLTKK